MISIHTKFRVIQAFKYLLDKPIEQFQRSAQFLQILAAEGEGLVTVDIHIEKEPLRKLTQEFYSVYLSDLTSADATAWNKIREDIIMEMLQLHVLPLGARWAREWLKDVEEEWVVGRCTSRLEERVDVAPYQARGQAKGETPRVLAISQGRGNNKRDWLHMVVVNKRGRFLNHEQLYDLSREDTKQSIKEHIAKFKPDVIVVGGFTPNTLRVQFEVRRAVWQNVTARQTAANADESLTPEEREELVSKADIKVIYAHDDVARLFQNSKRATTEFGELAPVARYCLGLARYVQSPLHEFASLGEDLTAISYDPHQKLVSNFVKSFHITHN
jgi:transcription elongation factor SPT6